MHQHPSRRIRHARALPARLALVALVAAVPAALGAGLGQNASRDAASPAAPAQLSRVDEVRAEVAQSFPVAEFSLIDVPADSLVVGQAFNITLPIAGAEHVLDLAPYAGIRSNDYQVLEDVGDGVYVEHAPGELRTLKGSVRGINGSRVYGGIVDTGLILGIDLGDGQGSWWVEPASQYSATAAPGDHIVYNNQDITECGGTCATENDVDLLPDTGEPEGGVAGGGCTPFFVAEIAIDADNEYYNLFGSVSGVENWVSTIINTLNIQYQNQTEITHTITTIIVRSNPSDPYTNTTSPGSLLNQVQNHWNSQQGGVQRDLVQLFTGRNLDAPVIGIANLASVCVLSQAYSLVQHITGASCRSDLSAHEIGHMWAAQHCSCPGNTMNSSLTCANNFTTTTINTIVNFRNSRTCLTNDCVPDNDDCANFITVGNGTYTIENGFAFTDGPAETLCSADSGDSMIDSDLWWRYVAECDGLVNIRLCGANFDSKIAVYEAFCPATVNQAILCSNDDCGNDPDVTFMGEAGVGYIIRVGGHNGSEGTGSMVITGPTCVPPPANDVCGSATAITVGSSTPVDTAGATSDGPTDAACTEPQADVWYRIFSTCTETLTFSFTGDDIDPAITIYGALCPSGPDTELGCDATTVGGTATVQYTPSGSGIIRIRVGSSNGATGTGSLDITCGPVGTPCPGDTNGDDVIDVTDLVAVVLDWGTDGSANGGDVDGSGLVDVSDLVAVVLGWGPCPM